MLGVKIIMTGDKPAKDENAVIIMNHRCRLDWMFFWSVVARSGDLALKNEKIMMKNELKYIPGPGQYVLPLFKFGHQLAIASVIT